MKKKTDNVTAHKLYKQAKKLEEKEAYGQAIRFYKASILSDSSFQPSLMGLGVIHSRLGETQIAYDLFLQAHKIKPSVHTSFNLGSEAFKLEKNNDCRKYLKECLAFDKHMTRAHLLLAYLYQKMGKFEKAAVYFQNAIKIDPMNRMAILGYATALSKQGHYETALYATEKYLNKISPKEDLFAKDLQAHLLLQLNHTDAAYKSYSHLIQHLPKFTNFSKHLEKLQKESTEEYKKTFENIDEKINERLIRLRKRIKSRKELSSQNLSPQENGIEGSQDLLDGLNEELRDMVDLSLLHLFKGDQDKAIKYLFQARKQKGKT